MGYAVKSLERTIQGEGANAGRVAVFLRFAGCNLWSGREADRDKGAGGCSAWCDTDFVGTDGPGGGRFRKARDLAVAAANLWPGDGRPFVVLTGGEPLLQADDALLDALHLAGFEIAVETNGTRPLGGLRPDWVTVSPKAGAGLLLKSGDELKLIYPQAGAMPDQFIGLGFDRFYLQPLDGPRAVDNTKAADHCMKDPRWSLSLQLHKFIGIP